MLFRRRHRSVSHALLHIARAESDVMPYVARRYRFMPSTANRCHAQHTNARSVRQQAFGRVHALRENILFDALSVVMPSPAPEATARPLCAATRHDVT